MFKRILPLILLALCLAAAPVVLHAGDSDKPKDKGGKEEKPLESVEDLPRDAKLALLESQQLLDKGETQKAVDQLGKYVHSHEQKGDSYVVRYQYATMLVQADKREDALKEYERVVELEPRYDAGWMGIGETAYGLGQYAKAADALLKGYDLSADKRPEVLYYAAAARLLAGDAKNALPLLDDLTSGKHGAPKFEWFRGYVSGCLQAQDNDRGQAAVSTMLEKFPDNPDAWYLSFQYYASVNNYRQAAVSLTIVSYLRPLTRQEQLQLGDLYAAVEAPAVAAEHYAIATQDSASSSEIERVASAYLASYQSDQALKVLNEGLKTKPTFQLWSLLGDLQVMDKHFDEAYKAFDQCVKLDPEKPRPYLMLGYCSLELNDPEKALDYLNKIADNEELKDRAKMLIQRAKMMESAPTPDGDDDGPTGGQVQSLSGK